MRKISISPLAALLPKPVLRAVVLCWVAGFLFSNLHVPLPWMLGPLLSMAAGKFFGAQLRPLKGGREAGQVIIGTTLGLYFTPVVLTQVLGHIGIMVLATIAAITVGYANAWMVARLAKVDKTTAFFGSVPGGATEMANLADRFKASSDLVAMAQSLRILLVVSTIPPAMAFVGASGLDPFSATAYNIISAPRLVLLFGLMVAAGFGMGKLRMPNCFLLGPLIACIALTASEIHLSAMPHWISNLGQLLIGCALGARLQRESLISAPRYVAAVLLGILAGMAMSALAGILLAWFAGLHPAAMILATAPGGLAEMALTARNLHLAVPMVTGFHVTRVIFLVSLTTPIFRMVRHVGARFSAATVPLDASGD